jgi:nicotinamide riboside transporter PnuC
MPDRREKASADPRVYQRKFFPLVPYHQLLVAALVGGIIGALCVFATDRGEYWNVVVGSALIAQALLDGFAFIRQRHHD